MHPDASHSPTPLILATQNRHKVAEIQSILGPVVACRSMADLVGAPELVEDGATFADNAARKARQLADWLVQQPSPRTPVLVLADDSGLEVDALNGEPGVRSARFAAEDSKQNAPDRANNDKLLGLLRDLPEAARTARFRCVLAVVRIGVEGSLDPSPLLFEGACEGRIGTEPRGRLGFGYDPLFLPHGQEQTFAEMEEQAKNAISHRRAALDALRCWLDSQP